MRQELEGEIFGSLTAIKRDDNHRDKVICKCECGNTKSYFLGNLRKGYTKSCGCTRFDHATKHSHYGTPVYRIWNAMIQRCHNAKDKNYFRYGGRGITVCEEWKSDFRHFLRDMGERPEGLCIDRIDNDKGYSQDNCEWVSQSDQMQNTRKTNRYYTDFGEITMTQWARKLGVTKDAIRGRLRRSGTIKTLEVPKSATK